MVPPAKLQLNLLVLTLDVSSWLENVTQLPKLNSDTCNCRAALL